MNKKKLLFIFFGLIFTGFSCFSVSSSYKDEEVEINPKTGFPEIIDKPFLSMDEGISGAMITRIIIPENNDKSNFVYENYLIGAYYNLKTEFLRPFNYNIKTSAYYPFKNTFRGMDQPAKQVLLYAFDVFAGPTIQFDSWKYIYYNVSVGLHYMYQLTDDFHMNYLGLGALVGIALPVAHHWTVNLNGSLCVDYPNLGTNSLLKPFNYAWQYHLDLGVCYSRKKPNKYSYIHSRKRNQ